MLTMTPKRPGRRRDPQPRPRRSARRLWCIPPAIVTDPDEPLEGMKILAEFPGDTGHMLWQGLREVTLWASMEPGERRGFLAEKRERRLATLAEVRLDPSLAASLTGLAAVIRDEDPDPALLSLLCTGVSEWAIDQSAPATALAYAQAGALAHPESAAPALRVAQLALAAGQSTRGETWLRRAVGLARREKRWDVYAGAYVELGTLYRTSGRDRRRAERYLLLAARAARRNRLPELVGYARHGLLLLRLDAGDLAEAARHAAAAARAYGRRHPVLPRLRRDYAHLLVRQGDHPRAVRILRELLPLCAEPEERMQLHALHARAAAESGDVDGYRESWLAAWTLVERHRSDGGVPAALLELARASAAMRDVERVQMIARHRAAARERAAR
jgi:hypothetical protein